MLEKEAKMILKYVGGAKNVNSLVHCATRLRFDLVNKSEVNKEALEHLPYVLSVVVSGGQFQVVIGAKVNDYYEEIIKYLDNKETQHSKSILKIISGAFSPLIPILAGSGMVKALLTVFVQLGVMSETSSTFAVLSATGNAIFYFIPIFLGITLSNQFGSNPYVGGAIGAALLEPNFTGLIGDGTANFLGISITAVDYATTIFPIFIISFVYAFIEKKLKKIIKKELQLFLVPMICLMVLVPMAILVFGPFGTIIGDTISSVFMKLFSFNRVLAGFILGAVYPYLTILGLHWGFTPITLQNLSINGGDIIEGVAVCCVYAELGIALGAYLKGKKGSKIKYIAGSNILTGFLAGVTEPILYGIIMHQKRLLAIVAIAGGIGGMFNGFFKVTMDAYVFHNVFSALMMSYSPFLLFLVGITISFVTGMILTYIFGTVDTEQGDSIEVINEKKVKVYTDGENIIKSPMHGTVVLLKNIDDEVFASGTAGQGIAIQPTQGIVYAPFDGEVVAIFPSLHAIGLRSENGTELLIHVGLNTVMLDGKYFTLKTKQGEKVKLGDVLLEFDLDAIEKEGYSLITPILVTNVEGDKVKIQVSEDEEVEICSDIMNITM